MKKSEIEKLIAEYLSCSPDSERADEIRKLLEENGCDLKELEGLENLYEKLGEVGVPEPGEEMHRKFYTMLEEETASAGAGKERLESILTRAACIFSRKLMPRLAFGIVFLFMGWAAGFYLTPGVKYNQQIQTMSAEIRDMREMMMLTMLEKPSASERMKAVNLTGTLEQVDDHVIDALIRTLNSDPNVNVRLVTVETLAGLASSPKVREELVQSITNQESPLVQLALADVMVSLQERSSVEQFNKLLQRVDLNDTVRSRIERSIQVLQRV